MNKRSPLTDLAPAPAALPIGPLRKVLKRAGAWARRHYTGIVLVLSAAVLALLLYGLVSKGYLDQARLKASKDSLAALNSLVGILAIVLGFFLSYFRFFAGRTFVRKGELTVTTELADGPDGSRLHAISVKLQNKGTQPIYDVELSLHAVDRLTDGTTVESKVETWLENREFASEALQSVVDPDEAIQFHATRTVGPAIWSTSYAAVVRDRHKNVWQGFALASPKDDKAATD